MISSATWLKPILMSSAATRMSAATATSAPPPSACPFSAAIVGAGNAGDAVADRPHPPRHGAGLVLGAQRAEFLQVAAGDEGPVACAGDDERGRALGPVERLLELVHRLQRDGVAGVRTVDGDDRQAVVQLQVDHRAFSVCGIGILSSGE